MSDFESKDYKIFELFQKRWALVAAGDMEVHNACTVSWGSMGTLWTRPGKTGAIVTVYIHPARYTQKLLVDNGTFTVSFFPPEYKKALAFLGSHSGRDGDKIAASGLTLVPAGESVGFKEAELTFVCRKLYQHRMTKEDIAQDVRDYYIANPKVYPLNEKGEWEPHWVFVGEITDVIENQGRGESEA